MPLSNLEFPCGFDNPSRRLHPSGADITHLDGRSNFIKRIIAVANKNVKYQPVRIRSHRKHGADVAISRLGRFDDNPFFNCDGKRYHPAISLPPDAGSMKGCIQYKRRTQRSGFFEGAANYRCSEFCNRSLFMNGQVLRDIVLGRTKRDQLTIDFIR